jgi:hypothetical protein
VASYRAACDYLICSFLDDDLGIQEVSTCSENGMVAGDLVFAGIGAIGVFTELSVSGKKENYRLNI